MPPKRPKTRTKLFGPFTLPKSIFQSKYDQKPYTGPLVRVALAATAAATLASCAPNLSRIDTRTERLLEQHTARINSEFSPQVPPADSTYDPDPAIPPAAYDKPPTTNPDAEDLSYRPADPARNLEDRLLSFSAQAAGLDGEVEPFAIDLTEAFRLAQRSSREYQIREEDYILSAIALLMEQHRWGPRLFNDTSALVAGQGSDGAFDSALNVINDLRVTQRLPYGGEIEARWIATAVHQLQSEATGRYRQSSELALDASIPLMRGSGLVAREPLIQAERSLVYAARDFERFRRSFLVDIASDYFDLLESQARIANQKVQLAALRRRLEGDQLRAEAGFIAPFNVSITENQVLAAVASLAASRDAYIAQQERFKVRLGLDVDQPLIVRPLVFDLAEPDIDLAEAVGRASEFRLDYQNEQDRLADSLRQVAIAKDSLRPDLDLTGSVSVPTNPSLSRGGLNFDPGETNYAAGILLSLPLDRRIERLGLRSATIAHQRDKRALDQFKDLLIIDVRSAVRGIELARFQLQLAERRVQITELRRREQEIKRDRVTSQEEVDTLNDLLDALNARDAAQTDLRVAILRYLLQTGQLRVGPGGQLEPLPGMDVLEIRLFSNIENFKDWHENPVALPGNVDESELP